MGEIGKGVGHNKGPSGYKRWKKKTREDRGPEPTRGEGNLEGRDLGWGKTTVLGRIGKGRPNRMTLHYAVTIGCGKGNTRKIPKLDWVNWQKTYLKIGHPSGIYN